MDHGHKLPSRLVASLSIEQVDPASTVLLRREVLRPHQGFAELLAETDAIPDVFAIAALVERQVVSCALAGPEPCPDLPSAAEPWRVRGMATDPQHRGQGLGSRVLARVMEEVRRRGGRTIWCNARVPARALYERAGFRPVGDPWVDPVIGPHLRMCRALEPWAQ